jgi:hypothetical protein
MEKQIRAVDWQQVQVERKPLQAQDHPIPTMIINNADWQSDAPAFRDLERAIRRAADDLDGQGERSCRIATQLLTALALYHAEVGT